jgi:hypothetical protein
MFPKGPIAVGLKIVSGVNSIQVPSYFYILT